MEKIMELIKKKGIDKDIQDAVNKSYVLTGGNISQDDITEAVKNITCQPDVCEEKGDDLKENLIEQVGNVHQGLAAILKFLS